MVGKIFLPRKNVGVPLLFFTFFIILVGLFWGYYNPSGLNTFLQNELISLISGESIPYLSPWDGFSFIINIFSDFKICITSIIVPFGFLISLSSFIINSIALGNNLLNLKISSIIFNLYFMYIMVLSMDSGVFITLNMIKREKNLLKDEIYLFIDRIGVLIVIIFMFNFLGWCFS